MVNSCLRCGVSVSDFDVDDIVVGVVLDDDKDDGGGDLVGLRQEVISEGSWSVLLFLGQRGGKGMESLLQMLMKTLRPVSSIVLTTKPMSGMIVVCGEVGMVDGVEAVATERRSAKGEVMEL